MGTKETKKAQKAFKQLLSSQGWSLSKFARAHYMDNNDTDNEQEIKAYIEKIKKQLSRNSTKVELIESYIDYIQSHYDFINIIPKNHSIGKFNSLLEAGLREVSEIATKIVSS